MPEKEALENAAKALITAVVEHLCDFNTQEFLRTGIDPFRFTVNVSLWGMSAAIRKEVEHKLEMAMENSVGDFHENYLGHLTRKPAGTKWRRIPEGEIPGADIANEKERIYLQLKSKHNSMNSSSSKRLGQEIKASKQERPGASVGCAWVIAKKGRTCIGEKEIRKAGGCVLKGKEVYDFVSGNKDEMEAVLRQLPELVKKFAKDFDLADRVTKIARQIECDLRLWGGTKDEDVIRYVASQSVD